MSNVLYTYGTLRPGDTPPVVVRGSLYDLGPFPGLILDGKRDVVCEKVEIEDWGAVDRYEGYYPEAPEMSLYIRRPYEDGFIYEFNREVPLEKLVESGDWLKHKDLKRGHYGNLFRRAA